MTVKQMSWVYFPMRNTPRKEIQKNNNKIINYPVNKLKKCCSLFKLIKMIHTCKED